MGNPCVIETGGLKGEESVTHRGRNEGRKVKKNRKRAHGRFVVELPKIKGDPLYRRKVGKKPPVGNF